MRTELPSLKILCWARTARASGEAEVLPSDPVGDDEPCCRGHQERDEVLVVRVGFECGENLTMSLLAI